MTNFEQKYQEFRDAFRDAVLNKEVEYKVEKQNNPSYKAKLTILFCTRHIEMTVAKDFICYHNTLVEDVFTEKDIQKINQIIDEWFMKDKDKYDRIEQLKRELYKLEKEVA